MVYDDSEIAIINIEIDPQSLSWIFDSANLESDSMHVASVHFQNAHINEHIDSIGFRIRGNTSRNADKKSFKIDFIKKRWENKRWKINNSKSFTMHTFYNIISL